MHLVTTEEDYVSSIKLLDFRRDANEMPGEYRKKLDTRQCLGKSDCRVKKLVNRTVWEDLLFPACRTNIPITTPLISGRAHLFSTSAMKRAHSEY